MTIPAKSSVYVEATLMCPTRDNVFDGSSQDVTIVGQARGKRGTIIEGIPEKKYQLYLYVRITQMYQSRSQDFIKQYSPNNKLPVDLS